jgi:hypothetical protein
MSDRWEYRPALSRDDCPDRVEVKEKSRSTIADPLKQRAVDTLKKRHHERRAPYVRELDKLGRRVQRTFA